MQERRLYRDTRHHVIGGVCSGLGKYLNVDPIILRILLIMLALLGGGGVIIYIILWIVIPEESYGNPFASPGDPSAFQQTNTPYEAQNQSTVPATEGTRRGGLIAGIILIGLGVLFLVDQYIPRINIEDLWPVFIIIAGVALVLSYYTKSKEE
ncbi:MAG: PspC domain-containing protein [Bacteroidales bacterium]|nr:PspC domain-containing protein [Bacteroidales bacterium]